MKCKYLTIEREYGSGGTKIAHRLAEECGLPCYGAEILEAVAKNRGVSVKEIERYEEKTTNSFLYTIFMMSRVQTGDTDMLPEEGHIYLEEHQEIQHLAAEGPAIFLGHCASEALRGWSGVVKVFIRAADEKKRLRIIEDYKIAENQVELTQKRFDKKRANYYNANTARDWHDMKNYDIVLDSSELGIDGCVSVLKGLF
jgi:cytidylate kinase